MYTIHIKEAVVRHPSARLSAPVSLDFGSNEHLALVGPNGAGKSLFVDMLTGKYPLREGELTYNFSPLCSQSVYENVKYLTFRDTYGPVEGSYYQQRWNAHDQDDFPTVRQLLGQATDESLYHLLLQLFELEPLLDKKIVLLSSGELRKFQLTKVLLTAPRILILDNPFIGLDAEARRLLTALLEQLSSLGTLQLILVLSMLHDIPAFITHVVPIENRTVGDKMTRTDYLHAFAKQNEQCLKQDEVERMDCQQKLLQLPDSDTTLASDEVVKLNRVSIQYGNRTILHELNWTVHRGEKWALCGENGAGKSTLLSLVCADNPQSYACDIALFGRKRGSGESIWEIKRHIGYVSPEMHRAYQKNLPAIEIVASGLHDSIGLYRRPQPEQMETCLWWMDLFGIAHLHDRPFLQLSSGEQRLVLLARAFVKDPELLILDEPLHGLDTYRRRRVKSIIEAFCSRKGKTLIMVTHYQEELPAVITHRLELHRHASY